MTDLFLHPVFKEAIADIESLGVSVSSEANSHSKPYAVIGGRSNVRWWLIPLENNKLTESGLALFQPLLASARYMKAAASILSSIGLSRLWVKHRVHISSESLLAEYFQSAEPLSYAYFTGTNSPHRKVAVQIMDDRGNIKGFAKLTRNPKVRALLEHEALTLGRIQGLGLESAYIPNVLFFGNVRNGTLLVTDTLKTPRTPSMTKFSVAHHAFMEELSRKTVLSYPVSVSDMAKNFRTRFLGIRPYLEKTWCHRLDNAISALEKETEIQIYCCLNHGDFTPWNTFLVNDRLYVFDWEYADIHPIGSDLIHFILAMPDANLKSPAGKINLVIKKLLEANCASCPQLARTILIVYLCGHALYYIDRESINENDVILWDGAMGIANLIDELID